MRGTREHLVEVRFLRMGGCLLLRRARCGGGFRGSGRNILDCDIGVLDVTLRVSRIVISGILGPEVQISASAIRRLVTYSPGQKEKRTRIVDLKKPKFTSRR